MAERPVLSQRNLVVSDMERCLSFYRLLGVEVPEVAPESRGHHRSAAPGDGVTLDFDSEAFATEWNRGRVPGANRSPLTRRGGPATPSWRTPTPTPWAW